MGTTPRRTGLPVRKRDGENGLTKSTEENHDLNIFETVKAAVTVKQAAEYCVYKFTQQKSQDGGAGGSAGKIRPSCGGHEDETKEV